MPMEEFYVEEEMIRHHIILANSKVEPWKRCRDEPELPVSDNVASVLMGTCFWRLVIDELQMMNSRSLDGGRNLAGKMV